MDADAVGYMIQQWCVRELAYWQAKPSAPADWMAGLLAVNRQHRNVFLLRIEGNVVTLADKEPFYTRAELDDPDTADLSLRRALLYRTYIGKVLARSGKTISTVIAFCTNDIPIERADVPIFGFQKSVDSRAILLPDVDFLSFDFYASPVFNDLLPYSQKDISAVFVGSTSGGGIITPGTIRAVPRIRAALHFKWREDVIFRLPSVVMCDSPETEEMVRALDLGGERISYEDQFQHRFIISMDGNGATCSRVAISLKSGSALLKYDSPYILYYFQAMLPWIHYIPVHRDSDIDTIVGIEASSPGAFAQLARNGTEFYDMFLRRERVAEYTTTLLAAYAALFPAAAAAWPDGEAAEPSGIPEGDIACDVLLHIQGRGDTWWRGEAWNGQRGSGLGIEGIAIRPRDPYLSNHLEYRVLTATDGLSDWHQCGDFAGSRGRRQALLGISLRIVGNRSTDYDCIYEATCTDGTTHGPADAGTPCGLDGDLPLESIRIQLRRKQ